MLSLFWERKMRKTKILYPTHSYAYSFINKKTQKDKKNRGFATVRKAIIAASSYFVLKKPKQLLSVSNLVTLFRWKQQTNHLEWLGLYLKQTYDNNLVFTQCAFPG